MMNFIEPYLGELKAVLIVGAGLALFWAGHHFGAQGVQSAWDREKAAAATAAVRAVDQRIAENQIEEEKNRENNRLIQQAHDAELDRVRADVSNAPRLRPGAGICGESPGTTEAGSAGLGNATDTGGRVVREDVQRDLDALKLKVEEAFAAGRACQKFVTDNGMGP